MESCKTRWKPLLYYFLATLFVGTQLSSLIEFSHWLVDLQAHLAQNVSYGAALTERSSQTLIRQAPSNFAPHECHSCVLSHFNYLRGTAHAVLFANLPDVAGLSFIYHAPLDLYLKYGSPAKRAPPSFPNTSC